MRWKPNSDITLFPWVDSVRYSKIKYHRKHIKIPNIRTGSYQNKVLREICKSLIRIIKHDEEWCMLSANAFIRENEHLFERYTHHRDNNRQLAYWAKRILNMLNTLYKTKETPKDTEAHEKYTTIITNMPKINMSIPDWKIALTVHDVVSTSLE